MQDIPPTHRPVCAAQQYRPVQRGRQRFLSTLIATVSAWTLLWSTHAAAQEETFAEPTKEQMDLYKSGAEAFKAQQWTRAIERFEASLSIGQLNITYLNLGRAYFKAGQCKEANAAYAEVARAPQIRQPSPAMVLEKLDEYRSALESCPGTLRIQCNDPEAAISATPDIKGACGAVLEVPAGQYTIKGKLGEEMLTQKVVVEPMGETTVLLGFSETETSSPVTTAGWIVTGVGVAALVTGGVIFALNQGDAERFDALNAQNLDCPQDPSCRELNALQESLDSANMQIGVAVGVGAGALITGAAFLLWGDSEPSPSNNHSRLLPLWQPGLVGVQGRF